MAHSRFAYLSDSEIADLQKKHVSKSTKAVTNNALKTFLAFCIEENYYSIGVMPLKELNKHLTRFYAGARTEKGELYKINTMHALRGGLQRHFSEVRNIDIINDEEFNGANI